MDFGQILQIAVAVQMALQKARHIPSGTSEQVMAPDFNLDGDPEGVKIKYKGDTYEIEGFVVKKA